MSLFKRIKKIFYSKTIENHDIPEYSQMGSDKFLQKIGEVYGEDKLKRQQLFEHWCVKDYWKLKAEAIPLSLGLDPHNTDWHDYTELQQQISDLFEHAIHCIEHNMSLTVRDLEQDKNDWQVIPSEFYCWASVSRIDVPEQMSALMEFILSSVKTTSFATDSKDTTPVTPEVSNLSLRFDKDNEVVLGAALALLAKYPEQCQDSKGKVKVTKITSLIEEYKDTWFEDEEPDLSNSAREDLINKWLGSLH